MADRSFKPTTVVLFSGGLDSGVLTHTMLAGGETVLGLSAVYGSRHNQFERGAVDRLEQFFGNVHTGKYPGKFQTLRYDLEPVFAHADGPMFKGDAAPIPHGHCEGESMRQTVVPGRNLLLIALAASVAEARGAKRVVIGAHAGDHFIYPDCRPKFLFAAKQAVGNSTDGKVTVNFPFVNEDKKYIVEAGLKLGFPFHLTRTCYSDQKVACGKCGACQERLEAFAAAGADDPLEYDCRALIPASPGPVGD